MLALRSLRAQLTVAFAGIAGIVVLACAVGTVVLVDRSVWVALDARLSEEAETLAMIDDMDAEELARAVTLIGNETDLGAEKFVVVIGADGQVRASRGA